MRTNVLNDLSNVVKKGTILAGSAAAAVDSCAAGSTTLAEYPGNHPVITQLSPRNHPLLDAIWKHVAMIFAVLVMSMANIGMAWGDTELFSTDFTKWTTQTPTAGSTVNGVWFKSNSTITNGTGWVFSGNASTSSNFIAIPLSGVNGEITVTITFPACRPQWNVSFKESDSPITISGNAPSMSSEPSSRPTGSNISTYSFTHTISKSYAAIYIGKGSNGASSLKSITITTPAGGGGSTYSITYHCNDATSGCPATNPATGQTALPNPLPSVTKTNYTFGGWYTDAAYSSAASAGESLSDNADLYAKWTQTITLDREGASTGSTSVTATYNSATLPSITNPTKDGYTFEGWYDGDNGTGNLVINTSGALQANVSGYTGAGGIWTSTTARTLHAKWTEKAADPWIIKVALSGSSGATKTMSGSIGGTSTASGLGASSPYKIGANEAYVSLTLASGYFQAGDSVVLDLSKQGQIFWGASNNDNDHLLGLTTSKSSIHYFILPNTFPANTNTIHVGRTSSTYNGTLTYMAVYRPEKTCTAPNHVDISGRWDRFGGETISLTATAYSSEGTGSPIADGDITGWQWEKLIGSTWTALSNGTVDGVTTSGATTKNLQIANCGAGNSGKYRCVVSTGATCSTASATATDGSEGLGVKVYTLECYTDGTTVYNFTRVGDTQAGTCQIALAAGNHTFKFHADNDYYGNNGTIIKDETNWVCSTTQGNLTIAAGLGGTFTINMEYSTSGNSSVEGEPEISVTYPRKTIYFVANGDWKTSSAKFAIYYFRKDGDEVKYEGWTDFLSAGDCGTSAEIPQWAGVNVIAVRLNSDATVPTWDKKWNQTSDIPVEASKDLITITGWDNSQTYTAYSQTTYTISYAKGGTTATGGAAISGSKAAETKTCGVDFTLPGSAVFTATGYTQVGWTTTDGGAQTHALGGSYTGNAAQTFYPVWEATASLTALECNTLYKVEDMVASTITSITSTEQYAAGLSSNTKFEVLGTGTVNATGGPMAAKNDAATISGTSFTNSLYFKGAGNKSGEIPTSRGIKFIVPNAGKLDIYVKGPGSINIVKEGGSGTAIGSGDSNAKVTVDVTAGTYYLYATASSRTLFGIQLNCCTTPAAPTAFSAGSIKSDGVTFSITDAANAASYDIYYSTSNTAPNASTPVTTTSTEKTKAVTGLTASTTYYAWVRSVCDASHKSDWVALSGSSFTTTSTPAELTAIEANVLYQAADMANITFTESDQHFTGLSTNAKFKVYGTLGSSDAFGKNENHNVTDDIDTKNFTSALYITAADNTSSTSDPTKGAIEFITPSTAGTLYLYLNTSSSGLSIKKKGTSTSTSLSGGAYKKIAVEANTHYFINGAGSNRGLYGIKFITDVTAPTFVSSVPANGATDVATSGTIVLTFSEALGTVDASKFTLTGATKGTVTIDGSDATKVNITYTGAENSSTVILATAAAAVSDVAGNALAAALSNISFTTAAAAPAGDCITIAYFETSQHSNSSNKPDKAGKYLYGYTNSAKTEAYAYTITTGSTNNKGQGTGASDYLRVDNGTTINIYADNTTTGGTPANFSNVTSVSVDFKMNKSSYHTTFDIFVGSTKIANNVSLEGAAQSAFTTFTYNNLEQLNGKISIVNKGSGSTNFNFHIDNIQICTSSLPSCTTPVLPTLTKKTVCEGGDADAAWNATITNSLASGESVAYSWVKKGSSTVLSSVATYQPTDVTEAMAGTYVVTATVSADSKASKSASQEVDLSVTEGTEAPTVTQSPATVYAGNSVTLTATATTEASYTWHTCNSDGTGESSAISGATTNAYTIASAPAAGTHYYKVKVTGDGTHTCGTEETVYALTVSAASECQNYYWFIYADDATANGVINNRDGFFSNTTTGTGNTGTYTMTVDGTEMTGTKRLSTGAYKPKFTVPAGATATLYIYGKAASADAGKHLVLKRTSDDAEIEVTSNTTVQGYTKEGIESGEWTLSCGSSNWCYSFFAVKVCAASTCTDATPTITAANTTVCVGSELSISSTGYETGATFQWQKLNSSTSTWDNISGATSATYTVATAAAEHAGSYRLVATKGCARTSNTVTISVPVAPVFGSFTATRSVMATLALSITDVEASDATSYIWYKSANNTFEPGTDEQIGTSKDLIIGAVSEAANSTFYLFCVASNSCGSTTSGAITVNVTAYVEEDCATRDNMASAEFGFVNTSAGQGSYSSTACWTMNSNSKYLTYTAPEGKYFKTAKVTIASNSESKASYNWSTNGGTDYTAVSLTINSTLTERTINLSAHGNVNAIQIGRNFDSKGSSGGTLYVSKICFEYTEACTATTVMPSTESVNYEMGGEWSNPTFTLSVAGTLTYSSSNEDIASVEDDGTVTFNGDAGTVTITASYAGDETYCASSGSYTINVSCPGGAPKVVASGSVDMSGCNSSVTLLAKTQADGDFADGTYQWFRNGEEIDGATSSSYTAKQAGTYTVARTNGTGCTSPSTNSAIVTSETTEPEVERLVPFQYYHVDKTYSDQMKMRHLFAVKNSGTLDGKHFKMYVSRNGGAATDVTSSAALVVVPNRDGQHIDTVMVDLNELIHKYSENDEVVYTCKAIDCSGNVSDVYKNTITMRVIDATPTLALIISSDSVGDDFFRYKAKNLQEQTGGSAWSGEWPLYTYLKTRYNITPVNGYADFYKYNYEPFDILLLTDFPKTKPYGNPKNDNQKKQNTLARKALDDMADLCDFRPLLSFKTHMVQEETDLGHVSKWQAKGFTSNAVVPKTCQLRADIVCYAHPMFASLSTASSEINENKDNEAQKVFTLLSGEGYESGNVDDKKPKKGIQGFEVAAADNFVIIAYSHFDATATDLTGADAGKVHWTDKGKDRNLVAMCERQANIEARMILFSLNAGAHSKLTNAGMAVVDSCLQYLLDSDPLHVSDCSLVFDNNEGNGDGNWSTATNWLPTREEIPHANLAAHIKAPCTVNIPNASALNIRIEDEGSLIIPQGAALMVVNTIKRQDGRELSPTEVGDIHIGSSASGNGTLIFNNNDGDTKARVDMYSTAKTAEPDPETGVISAAASKWQYIGTPHNDIGNAQRNYYDSWLYQYDTENQGWTVIENGGPLVPFRGYCVTHPAAPVVFDMEGTLVATTSYDISVPANKYVVAANSWVAPIDINAITSDDMEGFSDQAIYFFNTGSDPDKEGELDGGDRWAAGTYVSVPIHSAPYTGDDHIPSMQGFYVWSETAGTLHLDYEKHVRGTTRDNILSGRMHAPRHAMAENSEPNVLKIFARGSRYDDRLIVLEREDFTRRYESGWDGEAWGGSDLSPMVYITNESGVDEAVSAIPEFEGTVITFKAGEDNDYHFDFIYDGEENLYLFDTENSTYTQIMTGESYYFSTDDKAPHSRFILTRRGPQIATGVGEVPSDQVQGTKAKKLLIENKMYILLNGALYDATGKAVK